MKVVIELSLEEALEYLRCIGKTSVADRKEFFSKHGVKPKMYKTKIGQEDIFGVIYVYIQNKLKVTFGKNVIVYQGYKVGDYVTYNEQIAKELGKYEDVFIIR